MRTFQRGQWKVERIVFRTADLLDSDPLAQLVNSAYRGEISRLGWTTEADFLDGQRTDSDQIQSMISTPNQVFLLACQDDALVGSVFLQKKPNAA